MLLLICWGGAQSVKAQSVGVKTNTLYWATTTPNIGAEVAVGEKTSFELMATYNPWTLDKDDNTKIKHWSISPEFRWWFCEPFNGHFLGVNAGYVFYNVSGVRIPIASEGSENRRYQGWAAGASLTYGYSWILGDRWNLEANVDFGYIYMDYDVYRCTNCGRYLGTNDRHYVGPTNVGLSFVYFIK